MPCTWDSEKNRQNVSRHGVAFEDAAAIFEGPILERLDDRFDYGEERFYAVGLVRGVEVTVIYTDRPGGERRIISAWRAERHEREAYWRHIG